MRSALKDPTLGLTGNPCRGVEIGTSGRRDVQPMDDEERARFCEAIRGEPHEALFLFLMGTGLRPGEALGLGWEHVELEAASLRVERPWRLDSIHEGSFVVTSAGEVRLLPDLDR